MISAIIKRADSATRTLYLAIGRENLERLEAGHPIRVPGDRLAALGLGDGEVEIVIELLNDTQMAALVQRATAEGARITAEDGVQ